MNTTIRDIDDWVIGELKQQAAASGRSLQAYLKHILGEVARTPLPPLTRDLFFELMKEFHVTRKVEPEELHLPRYGELWPRLEELARCPDGGSQGLLAEIVKAKSGEQFGVQMGGLKITFIDTIRGGHHGQIRGDLQVMNLTTELLWKLAGQVDCAFRLR